MEGLTRYVDESVVGERALILFEVEPDPVFPTVFAGLHTETLSWSIKDVLKPWVWETVRSEPVAPMKHVTLQTKGFVSGSQVD